jgi:hypothetical protein
MGINSKRTHSWIDPLSIPIRPIGYLRTVGQYVGAMLTRSISSQMQTTTITTTLNILAIVGSIGICWMIHSASPTTINTITTSIRSGITLFLSLFRISRWCHWLCMCFGYRSHHSSGWKMSLFYGLNHSGYGLDFRDRLRPEEVEEADCPSHQKHPVFQTPREGSHRFLQPELYIFVRISTTR